MPLLACLLLFTQCKPQSDLEDVETQEIERMPIYGEIMAPKSRLTIDGEGVMEWESDDCFYFFNIFSNSPLVFKVSAVFHNTPDIRGFATYNVATTGADYFARDLYNVSGTASGNEVIKDISVQSGKLSDLKENLMVKASIFAKKKTSEYYQFPQTPIYANVAIAHIDLPEMDCEGYYFDYEGCCNVFKVSVGRKTTIKYSEDTTKLVDTMKDKVLYELGRVCVNNSSKDTYVVFFPQEEPVPNTVVHIYADDEEIGTVVFPNGIRANKLYVGENGGAIQLKGRKGVVEEDLFVEEDSD